MTSFVLVMMASISFFSLRLLPESCWRPLFIFLGYIQRLKSWVIDKTESQEQKGLRLLRCLYNLERQVNSGKITQQKELPKYKSYTTLLEELLAAKRRYGLPLKQALRNFRDFLKKESAFGRHWEQELRGGVAQFFLIVLVTWIFIEFSWRMLERPIGFHSYLAISGCHFVGFFSYLKLLKKVSRYFFEPLVNLQQILFRFRLFRSASLSSHQVLELLNLDLLHRLPKSLSELVTQLMSLLHEWRENGIPIDSELEGLEDEVSLRLELARHKAQKCEKALRLSCLILFFVLPYFFYLFSLVGTLS